MNDAHLSQVFCNATAMHGILQLKVKKPCFRHFSAIFQEKCELYLAILHRLDCFFPELGKLVKEHVFSILFKTQHREKTATWQCHRKGVSMIG